ncbi:unnamed protein product, partial [Mesorhabditis spiculigera]
MSSTKPCGGCPTPTIDNSIINPTPFATNSITTDASGCSVLTLACTGTGPGLAYVAENVFIKFPGATIAVGCST